MAKTFLNINAAQIGLFIKCSFIYFLKALKKTRSGFWHDINTLVVGVIAIICFIGHKAAPVITKET